MAATYRVTLTTGSTLTDASGRATGPETTGQIISKHRTLVAARTAAAKYARLSPLNARRLVILDAAGQVAE